MLQYDSIWFSLLPSSRGSLSMFPSHLPVTSAHLICRESWLFTSLLSVFFCKATPFLLVHGALSLALSPVPSVAVARGWGHLLSAALLVQVALRPGPDPTALCIPHPPTDSAMCCAAELHWSPFHKVAHLPIYPLSEESTKLCSHFLTEEEVEFWEEDVEIQQCSGERERKKEFLAVISTLLVFPLFKPR